MTEPTRTQHPPLTWRQLWHTMWRDAEPARRARLGVLIAAGLPPVLVAAAAVIWVAAMMLNALLSIFF